MINRDVFGTQDDPDAKMAGGEVEEFGFLAGSGGTPGGGVGFHFRRGQDDGRGGEVFDEFGETALFPDRGGRRAGGGGSGLRTGAFRIGFLRRRDGGGFLGQGVENELQLLRIQLLRRAAKELAGKGVDLEPQHFFLLLEAVHFFLKLTDMLCENGHLLHPWEGLDRRFAG